MDGIREDCPSYPHEISKLKYAVGGGKAHRKFKVKGDKSDVSEVVVETLPADRAFAAKALLHVL